MNKEELIVELECNDVQVNIDDTRITYCNSLDKELVKAIYNLQQENKQLQARIDKSIEYLDKEFPWEDGQPDDIYKILKGE